MEQLAHWVFTELERRDSLFAIPRDAFFVPHPDHRFRVRQPGVELDTPFGVAAGPHSQMAQNIVAAWLAGGRVIELKTVQALDQIEVHKPCIDVQDEGYNVEWSQELRVRKSFDEYLRAWVLIHALHRRFGWPGERPGILFVMSVGYDLDGILQPNVQWYLDAMADASAWLPAYVDIVAGYEPAVRDIEIPARLSDTVTLSTMHGCPPGEIERIARYLLEERRLHTSVKCNPTLLGADRVRGIVNDELGYADVRIPDAAFGHDLRWADAVPMFRRLREAASARGLAFGLKLSNTLEVENTRTAFDRDPTMYLSGRALHPVTANLAAAIVEELGGELPLSFAGGADCFNVADLLASGMSTVTVTSDLLKTGGYLRLLQYPERLDAAFDAVGAVDIPDFVCRSALRLPGLAAAGTPLAWALAPLAGAGLSEAGADRLLAALRGAAAGTRATDTIRSWARSTGMDERRADDVAAAVVPALARLNLRAYASSVRSSWRYRRDSFRTDRSKTGRPLRPFDCIHPPCVDTCPLDQRVPLYMDAIRRGDVDEAVRITRADNPLAAVLGRACDHLCEQTCIRTHLDQPVAIRHIKRFVMEHETGAEEAGGGGAATPGSGAAPGRVAAPGRGAWPGRVAAPGRTAAAELEIAPPRVAIVGAGPAGIAAAGELARAGAAVTVFEARPYPGGMVGGAIPQYRLPGVQLGQDLALLERLGVQVRCSTRVGADVTVGSLRADGFDAVFVGIGAQRGRGLGLAGEDAAGVVDGMDFLRGAREGTAPGVGNRVGVIGGGDTAMDCARVARRLGAVSVSLIYRRSIDQMPADREEIQAALEEGIEVVEHARPVSLRIAGGRLTGVTCVRTEYRGERDASGRKLPADVPGSGFDLEFDTLILAVGQHAVLECFGGQVPDLTPDGYIRTDPDTLETSIPDVYAGGDAASHGPASIVRAAADGMRAARAIAASLGRAPHGRPNGLPTPVEGLADVRELVLRRARRQYRVPVPTTAPELRAGFEETVLGYTREEAMAEAERCLECHRMCSLCVGVCPNMAILTYEVQPTRVHLPSVAVVGGRVVPGTRRPFEIGQRLQVAVLADLCNECGTCVTACPTAGRPYRDKPRLYLDRADFEAQESNAFLLVGRSEMAGRFGGQTHRIAIGDRLEYTAPGLNATLDPGTFEVIEAAPAGASDGDVLSLEPAAIMATLLAGLRESAPHLPMGQGA
jgi:putative selenate reductase